MFVFDTVLMAMEVGKILNCCSNLEQKEYMITLSNKQKETLDALAAKVAYEGGVVATCPNCNARLAIFVDPGEAPIVHDKSPEVQSTGD